MPSFCGGASREGAPSNGACRARWLSAVGPPDVCGWAAHKAFRGNGQEVVGGSGCTASGSTVAFWRSRALCVIGTAHCRPRVLSQLSLSQQRAIRRWRTAVLPSLAHGCVADGRRAVCTMRRVAGDEMSDVRSALERRGLLCGLRRFVRHAGCGRGVGHRRLCTDAPSGNHSVAGT